MGRRGLALMLGIVCGMAWQLQQRGLWSGSACLALLAGAALVALAGMVWHRSRLAASPTGWLVCAAWLAVGALAGAGWSGWRAAQFAQQALLQSPH